MGPDISFTCISISQELFCVVNKCLRPEYFVCIFVYNSSKRGPQSFRFLFNMRNRLVVLIIKYRFQLNSTFLGLFNILNGGINHSRGLLYKVYIKQMQDMYSWKGDNEM